MSYLILTFDRMTYGFTFQPQFYIQLLYRTHLEHELCHLGCWAVSEKFLKRRNFCLSMLLFWVVFSCFHGHKIIFIFFYIIASALKSCKFFFSNWEEFFFVKNRLPLTIFWSEIVSVIQRGPLKTNCI